MKSDLKRFREARGLTQDELAKRVGLTESFVSRLETGKRVPSIEVALEIARVLDVGVSQIWIAEPKPIAAPQAGPKFAAA